MYILHKVRVTGLSNGWHHLKNTSIVVLVNVFHLVSKSLFSVEANQSTVLRLHLQSYNIVFIIPRDFKARYDPAPCHHLHLPHLHHLGLRIQVHPLLQPKGKILI